jgi:cbb3-type cytochrome oxidase subunit 1
MEWFVRAFLKASLAWLALGVTLGVAMAARPAWTVHRPAHVHMVLLGFVTMMIYGVAYHVVPRFSGNALHGRRVAGWHWWGSNVGLLAMVVGFLLRPALGAAATPILATGGTLAALGAYAFAWIIWRTIDGPASLRAAAGRARAATDGTRGPRLPLAAPAAAPAAASSALGERSRVPAPHRARVAAHPRR